jgi:hypothetical protein
MKEIKPGMSVNAEIIVEVKANVLTLPNSAIKPEGNLRYVQLIDAPEEIKKKLKIGTSIVLPKEVKIKNQPVKIGTSNDERQKFYLEFQKETLLFSQKITRQTQSRSMFQFPGMIPQRR